MIKKILIGVGLLLLGSWLWVKTDMGSYATTLFKEGKSYVKDQVPIEFEIKRARDMIRNLDDVDDKIVSHMAKEMVAIKHLEREIKEGEVALAEAREEIRIRNEQLKNGTFTVARSSGFTREQFALDLERRFKRYRAMEATLENKRALLAQHQERLAHAREQREALKAQKFDLESRLQTLETQVALLKAAEARHRYALNDSQLDDLNRVKELVDQLEKRIDTNLTELELREEIKTKQFSPPRNSSATLTEDIDEYFAGSESGSVAADR